MRSRSIFGLGPVLLMALLMATAACGDLEREDQDVPQSATATPTSAPQNSVATSIPTGRSSECNEARDNDHRSTHVTDIDRVDPELLEKAEREGTVSVIVTLDIPYTPEGHLSDQQAIEEQRTHIAAAQDELMESLEGFNAEETTRYERLRQIVITVDRAALKELGRSPLVDSIAENTLDAPTT